MYYLSYPRIYTKNESIGFKEDYRHARSISLTKVCKVSLRTYFEELPLFCVLYIFYLIVKSRMQSHLLVAAGERNIKSHFAALALHADTSDIIAEINKPNHIRILFTTSF